MASNLIGRESEWARVVSRSRKPGGRGFNYHCECLVCGSEFMVGPWAAMGHLRSPCCGEGNATIRASRGNPDLYDWSRTGRDDSEDPVFPPGLRIGMWVTQWALPLPPGQFEAARSYVLECICKKRIKATHSAMTSRRIGRSCGCFERYILSSGSTNLFAPFPPLPEGWLRDRSVKPITEVQS